MSSDMNLTLNGHSNVPPGFRFHPTEEELLQYYLRKKVAYEKIDFNVIREVDLNKLEPWDIQDMCKIGSTYQNDWYFFSHKDKKYPTGTRTNRATMAGFWKATGRDKVIYSNFRRIGMRKTLVFYGGRAPHGQKSDWIMHEYRLEDHDSNNIMIHNSTNNRYSSTKHRFSINQVSGDSGIEEGWVICRVFKKKNNHKALQSPSISTLNLPRNDGVLDQILMYMERSSSCKSEKDLTSNTFMQIPTMESPPVTTPVTDWATVDRLVGSQLNGQPCKPFPAINDDFTYSFDDPQMITLHDGNETDNDLWDLSKSSSSSDPLYHFSV